MVFRFALAAALAMAADAQSPVLPADTLSAFRWSCGGSGGLERIPVAGMPFADALRLTTPADISTGTDREWSCRIIANISAPVAQSDWLVAVFWTRSIEASPPAAGVRIVFEQNGSPWTKSVSSATALSPQWRRMQVPFRIRENYAASGASVHFWVGYDPQVIEIGGLELVNHGPGGDPPVATEGYTYPGREPDAPWRSAARERIEKYRMAPLPVRVTSGGAPVEGAAVRIRMQRHAFGFGTAVAAQQLLGTGADSDTYRSKLLELFNKAVLENDLKWPTWERNRQPALDALAWLRANGIADVRGHNIIWPGWQYLPADLRNLAGNPGAMRARVDARVTDVVTATRGQLTDWDVVNEPIPNRDIQNVLGDQELGRWFQMAHAADRDARLFLNEYSILSGGGRNRPKQDLYYQMIRDLLDQGAPVGGIGIQGHFGTDATQPERVIEILDRFAELGLPIQITEFDVNTLDEQFQADYLRDFTTLCFSHPRVDAFLMWGFWAGRHWLPEAALYRRDWSEKPNAVAWRKLLFDEWWTNADGTTSAAGEFKVRAFLGEYAIEVEHAGKIVSRRVTLVRDGEPVVVSLDE